MNALARPRPFAVTFRRAAIRLALAGAVWAGAVSLESVATRQREGLSAAVAAARERIATARAVDETRSSHGARYEQLRKRGLIGEGQRLRMVEALQRSAREGGLRAITFELQPPVVSGQVETSPIKLHVGLVHEEELLRLFDRLAAHAPAIVRVRHCAMERRVEGEVSLQRETDNLVADCQLEWLTVRSQ